MSPLGRYSDGVAALTALILVVAAVAAHLGLLAVTDFTWLDASSGIAVGVILGQRATTNGAGKQASAANLRLDAIGAPSAATVAASAPPKGPS